MATSAGPSEKLCEWACNTHYEDLPAEVRKEAWTMLYDEVGCMIASARLDSVQPVVDFVRKLDARGDCTVIGHPARTSILYAALANGCIGHADECDSTGQHSTGHMAATGVPTALTIGQHLGVSGKELVRAIAIGTEIQGRCTSVIAKYDTRREVVAALGHTLGASVNAGLLLGLNAEQMEHGLGLAAAGACGLYSHHAEPLHQIKSLEVGRAVEQGILSAMLAREGYHGPKEPLIIENGFFDTFLRVPSAGHEVLDGLGENYVMRTVAYKRYSVGGPDQAPLHAFIKLIKAHKLNADDIAEIEVSINRGSDHTITDNKHPSVHMETILSMAAVYGEITFAHVHEPRYWEDPRVQAFPEKARILIVPRPKPATRSDRLDTVFTVRTRDGKQLREQFRYPLMTDAEIEQKFRNLAGLRLDSQKVADLDKKLKNIETEKNVASLIRELEIPY